MTQNDLNDSTGIFHNFGLRPEIHGFYPRCKNHNYCSCVIFGEFHFGKNDKNTQNTLKLNVLVIRH